MITNFETLPQGPNYEALPCLGLPDYTLGPSALTDPATVVSSRILEWTVIWDYVLSTPGFTSKWRTLFVWSSFETTSSLGTEDLL